MAEKKYGKYIFKEPKQEPPQRKPVDARAITLFEDLTKAIGTFEINFNFVGELGPHVLNDPPHKHTCDEMLFFIPADPDIAPDLGGVVEIGLGDDWEKQTITTAAIITIPAGLTHCPVYVKKVTKPFYFGHCELAPRYVSSETPASQAP
jgi:hypothetical protein